MAIVSTHREVRTELFPLIETDVMGTSLRIAQGEGSIWINLSDVPKLLEAIRGSSKIGSAGHMHIPGVGDF